MTGTAPQVSFRAVLKNPRLWSPDSPFLYSGRLYLQENRDDQFTRFGVRYFTLDGFQIRLNGKRFKLAGANHHDDHPDWGSALPPHIIRQDIEILKRMGANAVRGHYPTDEMFMDYCDENGLVFMNEVPAWQYSTAAVGQALRAEQDEDAVRRHGLPGHEPPERFQLEPR